MENRRDAVRIESTSGLRWQLLQAGTRHDLSLAVVSVCVWQRQWRF